MRTLAFALGLVLCLPTGVVYAQAPGDSTYTVQSGDTLYRIARSHGVSVEALQEWNDLTTTTLQVGQILRVHPPSGAASSRADTLQTDTTTEPDRPPAPDSTQRPYGRHVVEASDTFVSLALRLGTTADSLWTLNETSLGPLPVGEPLRLPRRFGPPTHVVDSGDTLYRIAGQYGVSVRALRTVNDVDTTEIQPGQRLRLPLPPKSMGPPGEWAAPDTTGPAAVYPAAFTGRLMASGEAYDPAAFVVGHPSLPLGSVVLLSHPEADRHTFARVMDRGPVDPEIFLNVSAAAARHLRIETDAPRLLALRVVWRAE